MLATPAAVFATEDVSTDTNSPRLSEVADVDSSSNVASAVPSISDKSKPVGQVFYPHESTLSKMGARRRPRVAFWHVGAFASFVPRLCYPEASVSWL